MKIWFTVIFIILVLPVFSQNDSVHVVLDPEGHTALVKSVMFSPTGEELISVSDDKTIKVWDVKTGRLIRSIRGEIDGGTYGMLNSGAIHPNSLVAVGGMIGKNYLKNDVFGVRIMNMYTGEAVHEFSGPSGPVISMDFSPDGKYLATGALDNSIGIFSMEGEDPVKLGGHTEGVYGIAFSPDNKKLVSASYDNKLVLWDLNKLRNSESDYYTLMEGHEAGVRCVAFSPTGEYIVSGSHDNRLLLWDGEGNFIKELVKIVDPTYGDSYGLGDIHTVSFTEDGSKVVIGTNLTTGENAQAYSIPGGEKISSISNHNNTVIASAIFGNDLVATSGGDNRDIVLWNINTGKVLHHISSNGKRVYAIAASPAGNIAFGQTRRNTAYFNDRGDLEMAFDLNTLNKVEYKAEDGYRGVITENDGISFSLEGSNIQWSDGKIIEVPAGLGSPVCATFLPSGEFVIGTTYRIIVYDNEGKLDRLLDGHLAEINSISPSFDGKYLFSASADQTIMIWDLSKEGKRTISKEAYWESIKNQNNFTDEQLTKVLEDNGISFDQAYENDIQKKVRPTSTLFFSKNDDWIIWTDDNYYATSQKGSKYVGFHVNHGEGKEASFYTFEQFDLIYNRPDQVLGILGTGNPGLINMYYRAFKKRLEKLDITEEQLQSNIAAPTLELTTPADVVNQEAISLGFTGIASNEARLESIHVMVNDVPVHGSAGLPAIIGKTAATVITNSTTLILNPGRNKIQVYIVDQNGVSSNRESVYVTYEPLETIPKPNLYFYAVGVSEYKDNDMNLDYAAKDARDLANMFGKMKYMFGGVNIVTFTNENATYQKLMKIKSDLDKTEAGDIVIMFIAGHGLLDDQFDYYLGTYNVDFNDPKRGGILYEDLEDILDGIPARNKLMLIDACHSGEIDKEEVEFIALSGSQQGNVTFRAVGDKAVANKQVGLANSFELMKSRFADLRKSSGATIISSAGGAEYALEGDEWNNGVFTYSIIQGLLTRAADGNNDGKIFVSELQNYVYKNVSELTEGKQHPTSRRENLENDFIIWH